MTRVHKIGAIVVIGLLAGCNQVQSALNSLKGAKDTSTIPATPATQAVGSEAQLPSAASSSSSGANEYALTSGKSNELQKYALDWEAGQLAKGKHYKTAIGHATIVGTPGQDEYATGVDLAIKSAMLDADDQYALQQAQTAVEDVVNHYQFSTTGGPQVQAAAQQVCQDDNASNLTPKLKELANALANKAIQALDATPNHNTDLDTAIRCRYDLMVDRVYRSHREARQLAIRGGRLLRIYPNGGNLDVIVAYGESGLEIADEIKNLRPSSAPNPNAIKEIRGWVNQNILTQPDLLLEDGTRAFQMSNGEYALISTGIAGLPVPDGQMSDLEKRMRANSASKTANSNALEHIDYLAGRAVQTKAVDTAVSEENVSLKTVIKDGVATAKLDRQMNIHTAERDTNAISRSTLQGLQIIDQGVKDSLVAKQPIAYCIVAWSQSLVAQSQAELSSLQKDHSAPMTPPPAAPSGPSAQPSKPMKEDF